ncbi:MAG TPA: hypothetical protein VNF99_13190 [Stellaceae bacterium]|nr:hypothetical protein [Stellaceae bacterium]
MAKDKSQSPRNFSLHWGKGIIEEEVRIASTYHSPTIQLLKFTEGAAAGSREIRFCYYDHRGRFQRSPLIVDEAALPELRKALKATPRLAKLLKKLVAG